MAKEETKTDKELLLDEIKGLIADSNKEGVKKADLDARVEEINKELKVINDREDNREEVKTLKENVDKILQVTAENAAAIKAMNESPAKKADEKPMTFKEALLASIEESAKSVPLLVTERTEDGVKKISMKDYFNKLGNKNTPEMIVKAGVDMLETTIVNSEVADIRMTILDPSIVGTPLTVYQHVVDWMPVKGIANKYMSILVVYDYQDGSGTKTQGSAAGKSSFLLKTIQFVSATIGTYFRLSDESLDDLPEAMDEISRVAPSKIKDNIDYQILGSAGDDTATIKGLYAASKHTDFAGGTTYADTIPNANKVDVVVTMKLQAEAAGYMADALILNPLDIVKIAAEKDQLDNSKIDRRVVFDILGNPIAIGGLIIRKNSKQTVNTLTVVARKELQIGDRKAMTMEVGLDGNDFTEGYKTVRINVRLAFAVRDPLAVVYCDDLDQGVDDITKV